MQIAISMERFTNSHSICDNFIRFLELFSGIAETITKRSMLRSIENVRYSLEFKTACCDRMLWSFVIGMTRTLDARFCEMYTAFCT